MTEKKLRFGFTTGACAAAAALGAARMLAGQCLVEQVELSLPAGFAATFALCGQTFDERSARCFVVKDAGDDPDVTNGVEVHAELRWDACSEVAPQGLRVEGGAGIGRVTKPGLAVPVGAPAINPVPLAMIRAAVESVFMGIPQGKALVLTLSIPDGEARAIRTLNARLGILGGLSLLGTTGVVKPISHKAWTDTLDVSIDVALACGSPAVVLSTGRTSEEAARACLDLPEEAYVMMGDHVAYACRACHKRGVRAVVLSAQFAKLVKIACGHEQTHVSNSVLELAELAAWAQGVGLDETAANRIESCNTAREVYEHFGPESPLVAEVARRALARVQDWTPGTAVCMYLVAYDGRVIGRFGGPIPQEKEGMR